MPKAQQFYTFNPSIYDTVESKGRQMQQYWIKYIKPIQIQDWLFKCDCQFKFTQDGLEVRKTCYAQITPRNINKGVGPDSAEFTKLSADLQRGNSRTNTYVEVSGHNLESSQTWGFYHSFLPFYKVLFKNKLEFSSLIDCFVWISETIGVVWFSVRFSALFITINVVYLDKEFFMCKHCLDIRIIYN